MMRSTSYTLSGSSVARCRFFVVLGVVVGIGLARAAGVFRRFEEDDDEEEEEEEEEEEARLVSGPKSRAPSRCPRWPSSRSARLKVAD